MSDNGDLVRTALTRAFIDRDPAAFAEFWSDDYKQHNPMMGDGIEHLAGLVASLPDTFQYEIGAIVAEGDMVMVHGRYVGFAEEPVVAVDIFRVRDGKLAEHWDVIQSEVPADKAASGRSMFPAGV